MGNNSKTVKISVVVVCYNNFRLTTKCIDHIRNSSITDKEIILVDNASDDETYEWALKQDGKSITYLRNQVNLGCAIGRNQGSKWSIGKYILFLDNDQFIGKDYIEDLLSLNVDMAGCEHWVIAPDGITHRQESNISTNQSYMGSGGMLIKADLFDHLGGYDERFAPAWYEDVDFSFRAKEEGFSLAFLINSDIEHYEGGGATSNLNVKLGYSSKQAKQRSKKLFLSLWKNSLSANIKFYNSKPEIVFLVDVPKWAWDFKAKAVKKFLSDEFSIKIHYTGLEQVPKHDLLFTFEKFSQYEILKDYKYMIGVTAHTYVNFPNFEKYCQSAIGIHANSKMLYDEIKRLNKRTYYIPNGVDPELFPLTKRNKEDPFTVGYVGKNTMRKGLDKFIIPACQKAGVNLKIQSCKYKDDNRIDHDQMYKFYRDIDAIIIASDMDGTPNQLLEAASCGRMFLSCSIGNIPQFYNGINGFVVERNVDTYIERLLWMKNNREVVLDMGEEARKTVLKNWTWEIQAEKYRNMFKEVLS